MSDESASLDSRALVPISLRVRPPENTSVNTRPCLADVATGLGFLYLGRRPVAQIRVSRSGDGFAVLKAPDWKDAGALARRARRTRIAAMLCKGTAVLPAGETAALSPGTEISLDATPDTPATLYVPEMAMTIAQGEVVESGGHFAIRIEAPLFHVSAPSVSQQPYRRSPAETVYASMGWTELTLGQLGELADGSILRVNTPADGAVEAWTESGICLPATIEYRGGRLVLRILQTDRLRPPGGDSDGPRELGAALADLPTIPPETTGRAAADMLQSMPLSGLVRFIERSCALARPVILSLLDAETAAAVVAALTPAAAEAALEHAGAAAPTPLGLRLLDEALAEVLVAWAPTAENGEEATDRDELARMLRERLEG